MAALEPVADAPERYAADSDEAVLEGAAAKAVAVAV